MIESLPGRSAQVVDVRHGSLQLFQVGLHLAGGRGAAWKQRQEQKVEQLLDLKWRTS